MPCRRRMSPTHCLMTQNRSNDFDSRLVTRLHRESHVHSASVSLGQFGVVLDVLFADGKFLQFDEYGAHPAGTF